MLSNYLRVALRNILRQRFYALVNVVGLSLGLACCILLLLFVQHELSYDRFHPEAARTYRVATPHRVSRESALGPLLEFQLAEVERAARVLVAGRPQLTHGEQRLYQTVHVADPALLEMFELHLVRGDRHTPLDAPYSMILSADLARRFFGDRDPVGQVIRWDTSHEYRVTAVVDMADNTHFPFQAITSMATLEVEPIFRFLRVPSWQRRQFLTYVRLREGARPDGFGAKVLTLVGAHGGDEHRARLEEEGEPFLQPVTDIHLRSDLVGELAPGGDIGYVYLMGAIAGFVLLIACVNFVNLTTARSTTRDREVGLRKVVGARRIQLVGQFLGESALMVTGASVVSLAIVHLALPAATAFIGSGLTLDPSANPLGLGCIVAVIVATAALGGLYPALVLSAFQPARVLRGALRAGRGGTFVRRRLVEFQFAISLFLVVSAGVVCDQLEHMRTRDLGFSREQLVAVRTGYPGVDEHTELLRLAFSELPGVAAATSVSAVPFEEVFRRGDATLEGVSGPLSLPHIGVDPSFVETLQMELIAGRDLSTDLAPEQHEFLLTAAAVRAFGLEAPAVLGRRLVTRRQDEGVVVGVLRDFHFESMHHAAGPLLIDRGDYKSNIVARIQTGDATATLTRMATIWDRISPDYPFGYWFLDESFDRMYRGEERLSQILGVFALLAVVVAGLGVFALATHAVQQRTRELGVRKALGASAAGIASLLSREVTRCVLVANAVAWPVAYITMGIWLDRFPYRVDPGAAVFLGGGALVLVVAWISVGGQALRAAHVNPVDALRSE